MEVQKYYRVCCISAWHCLHRKDFPTCPEDTYDEFRPVTLQGGFRDKIDAQIYIVEMKENIIRTFNKEVNIPNILIRDIEDYINLIRQRKLYGHTPAVDLIKRDIILGFYDFFIEETE